VLLAGHASSHALQELLREVLGRLLRTLTWIYVLIVMLATRHVVSWLLSRI
jgi:hypothetical protein